MNCIILICVGSTLQGNTDLYDIGTTLSSHLQIYAHSPVTGTETVGTVCSQINLQGNLFLRCSQHLKVTEIDRRILTNFVKTLLISQTIRQRK